MRIKSIRSKIMASIMLITFLTVIAVTGVFYRKSAQLVEENYVAVLHQRIRLLADTVDGMLKEVCCININASCDGEIGRLAGSYLSNGNERELERAAETLRDYSNRNSFISSIYLFIPERGQIVTSLDYPVYKSEIEKQAMEACLGAGEEGSGPVIVDDLVHKGKKLLSFIDTVSDADGREIGYICSNIEENKFFYEYLDDVGDKSITDIFLLRGQRIIASGSLSGMGAAFGGSGVSGQWIDGYEVSGADKKYIYVYSQGAFSGCGVFARAEKKAILGDLRQMRKDIMGIAALFIFLSLIPAAYISRAVYKPVRKLTTAMQKVSQGEMGTRVEIVSHDEIGMMSGEFNRMLDQIEELIHQVILEDEMKKDAELEALQYQITPHFMYNTLNSIKCMAFIKGEKEIAGIIEDFARLLQTCISKRGAFLLISEEIYILKKYIRLQEFRNGEKYRISYEIQPEAEACCIPRLILQPLVENALMHGIDMKCRPGELAIRVWVEDKFLHIEVEDNGRGMTQEQIESLLSAKAKKTRGLTAVGVPNVRDRLKLYYKEEAELSYKSSSEGTTAIIYLPAIRDGEQKV